MAWLLCKLYMYVSLVPNLTFGAQFRERCPILVAKFSHAVFLVGARDAHDLHSPIQGSPAQVQALVQAQTFTKQKA